MPRDIINDPTDKGTKRPNTKPLLEAGRKFIPVNLLDFDFKITLPDDVLPATPANRIRSVIHKLTLFRPALLTLYTSKQNKVSNLLYLLYPGQLYLLATPVNIIRLVI